MKKRTAIMVVHGIGQQQPLETMSHFVSNFSKIYESEVRKHYDSGEAAIECRHRLKRFTDTWTESFVEIRSPSVAEATEVHVYEYYWAHLTQRQVSLGEVFDWMLDVAEGAKAFYDANPALRRNNENDAFFKQDGEFKKFRYLISLAGKGRILYKLILLLKSALKQGNALGRFLTSKLTGPLVDFMGDVTLYTTTDTCSQYYEVRRKILEGAVEKARRLLVDDDYDEVLLLGHSLGSVIAYDVVDRLNKETNVEPGFVPSSEKLKGLITFGSPLDKIAFFFDEKIPREQRVRRDLVSQLHSFRRRYVSEEVLENDIDQNMGNVAWINFWIKQDPVCGSLDVYQPVKNIELKCDDIKHDISIESHSRYWTFARMYRDIITGFDLR
jgi:hypothetical protein